MMSYMYVLVERCPTLLALTNGSLSTELATYGTVVEVSCPLGYHFPDFTTVVHVQCQEFGVWNDTVDSCFGE